MNLERYVIGDFGYSAANEGIFNRIAGSWGDPHNISKVIERVNKELAPYRGKYTIEESFADGEILSVHIDRRVANDGEVAKMQKRIAQTVPSGLMVSHTRSPGAVSITVRYLTDDEKAIATREREVRAAELSANARLMSALM